MNPGACASQFRTKSKSEPINVICNDRPPCSHGLPRCLELRLADEAIVDSLCRAMLCRTVRPPAAGARHMHDPALHSPVIDPFQAPRIVRKMWNNPLPLRVRKPNKSAICRLRVEAAESRRSGFVQSRLWVPSLGGTFQLCGAKNNTTCRNRHVVTAGCFSCVAPLPRQGRRAAVSRSYQTAIPTSSNIAARIYTLFGYAYR